MRMYITIKISVMLTLLILFSNCIQSSESLKILAIFPINGRSHYVTFERLAKGLAENGHQVDVYSHFPPKKSIPNYTFYSLEGSLPAVINNMSFNMATQFQTLDMKKIIDVVGTPICHLMDLPIFQNLLKNPPKHPPYDLVIIEIFVSPCYLAWGRHLNIPIVGMTSSTLQDWNDEAYGNPTTAVIVPNSDTCPLSSFWKRLKQTILRRILTQLFKYHLSVQNALVKKYFGPGYPDVSELSKDVDLTLVNMHLSLDGNAPMIPGIVPIGGLHIEDVDTKLSESVQKWLDGSKDGCIYFSFGSMVRIETFTEPMLKSTYAALKRIAPVRVLMKIAKPEELLPGLPSNVMTQSWLPQEQILKHKNIKAFITHGGLLGIQESIYYGVPMIGVPLFGDQHTNIEINVRRGISILLPLNSINEESLVTAIKEILNNPVYKKNVEKLSNLFKDRPMKALETAIFWTEYIGRNGKNVLQSPFVDMYWWQIYLLDVYFFILIVILLFCYIFKLLLKTIYHLFCATRKDTIQLIKSDSKKNR